MTKTSDTHQVHAAWQGYDPRALCFSLIFKKNFVYIRHLLGAYVPWHSCGGQETARGRWFSPPDCQSTQVVRHGGRCLYLLTHLASPNGSHFLARQWLPGEGFVPNI